MPEPTGNISLTVAQFKEIIQELRKPSAEDQEEIDKNKLMKERAAKQRVEVARQEMAAKAEREQRCNHKKEKGESAVFGQKHSDGFVHPICVRCQKQFDPYKPRAEDF